MISVSVSAGLPGDGAGEGMKLDCSLRVSNLLESVGDVDDADVIPLVRDFILLGGNDERVAFDLCALVEVAQFFAVLTQHAGLLDLRLIVAVVEISVP